MKLQSTCCKAYTILREADHFNSYCTKCNEPCGTEPQAPELPEELDEATEDEEYIEAITNNRKAINQLIRYHKARE